MKSFIEVSEESDFSIYNLPYGVFKKISGGDASIGCAIGEYVINLTYLENASFFNYPGLIYKKYFTEKSLNEFMKAGNDVWGLVRNTLQKILSYDNPIMRDNTNLKEKALIPMKEVKMLMPVEIGDYTDFYASKEHATNVGIMFRGKENALMPNWLHIPIGYHGRSSSVVVSGTNIKRPSGQTKSDQEELPRLSPSRQLDFELELGFFIGQGNKLGEPITIENASKHIFGMSLVNDWSARDIQKWEYIPLGPFLGKNFATSVSPWIVPMAALEPFKCKGPEQIPAPLPYLSISGNQSYDINLEVFIKTKKLEEPFKISGTNFKYMYWNIFQMLAHHTVNGCNTRTGDMMASGTISGHTQESYGSMLELAWKGEKPIKLPNNEVRIFLQDGDEIIIKGYCQGDGYRVGFGEVKGIIIPAE